MASSPRISQPPRLGRLAERTQSNERIRGYLKALAKETWEVVNWLIHAANASKVDGTLTIDATHSVLEAFGTALIRFERKTPERCGRCGSVYCWRHQGRRKRAIRVAQFAPQSRDFLWLTGNPGAGHPEDVETQKVGNDTPLRAWGEQAAHGCPKNVP